MIRGITVTLYERTQTGVDALNAPTYTETPVEVENVLVTPTAAEEVLSDVQLYGKKSVYTLSIPKGDDHQWENRRIRFFGGDYQSIGPVQEYIEGLTPLSWNRKVKVEKTG